MAKINVGVLGETSAIATIEALVRARESGRNFVSSTEYPFLFGFFSNLQGDSWKYRALVHHAEDVVEIVGYDIRTDLEGRVLRKEEVTRRGVKYYFNADAVDGIIRDLRQDCNREALSKELNRITNLLTL